jgi:hypothetical protein
LIRKDWDYSKGTLEILLSGGYGSAKSSLLAHLAITHCLANAGARVGIVRRSLPDLKATLWKEILDHLEDAPGDGIEPLREEIDYVVNRSTGTITFLATNSEIKCVSWADRRYTRMRSLKFSMLIIEEGSENDETDKTGFDEGRARLRRIPGVEENVLIVATNPDDPDHWLAKYFIDSDKTKYPERKVFYSKTADNIYLDPLYEKQLRASMDSRQVLRFLESKWVRLVGDRFYYAYDPVENYREYDYEVDKTRPVIISFDFNIALGKPLSAVAIQEDANGVYHIFGEVVVEGMRTEGACEELAARGYLDLDVPFFIVAGDAAGKAKGTRSNRSDYDIIVKYLANYRRRDGKAIDHVLWVPAANPPIRTRHNLVNGLSCNAEGKRRLFVYRSATTAHEGLKLVAPKKGADYLEDDTKPYQHISTALGYGLYANVIFSGHSSAAKIRSF